MLMRRVGVLALSLGIAACSGGGGGNPVGGNRAPAVSAGGDQSVTVGATVNLAATASDPDGDALAFTWSLTSRPAGSSAALANAGSATPSFVADVAGTYDLRVTVSDNRGGSAAATVRVVATAAQNQAPSAFPGGDQNVGLGATVTIAGNGTDPDNDPLACTWSFVSRPAGSNAAIANASGPCPQGTQLTATFPADAPGVFVVRLTVSDGRGGTTTSDIRINVLAANRVPTASAGPDQNVAVGANVTLVGSGTDPDNDPLTFAWAFLSRPTGSTASIVNAGAASASFVPDVAGSYLLQLTVSDGQLSASDTVRVTATTSTPGNQAPTLSVTAPAAVFVGVAASITATATDPDGDPVTISMVLLSRPPGSTAALTGAGGTRSLTPGVLGHYVVGVSASDGRDTASEEIAIYGNAAVAGNYNVTLTANFTTACNRPNESRTGVLPVQQPTAGEVVLDLPAASSQFTAPVRGTLRGEEFFYNGPISTTSGTVNGRISGTITAAGAMNLSFNIPVIFGCVITGTIIGAR